MLHRNRQCYEFIQEPCYIDFPFFFRNNHYFVILFGIFFPEFYNQTVIRLNRLLHIIQAAVARNNHNSFNMEIHLEHHRGLFHCQTDIYLTLLHLVSIDVQEEFILQMVVKFMYSRSEILQIHSLNNFA